MKTLSNLLRDECAAAASEYALMLAIVGGTLAVAALALGGSIANALIAYANNITF